MPMIPLLTPLTLRPLSISDGSFVPFRANPRAADSELQVEQFMRARGVLFPQFRAVNTMAAFLFPDTTVERLTTVGELFALLYYIDDVYGDNPAYQSSKGYVLPDAVARTIRGCAQALTTGVVEEGADALAKGFLDVRDAILRQSNATWLARLARSLTSHLRLSLDPTAHSWRGGAAAVEDYIAFRDEASGMYPTIDLIEFTNDMSLPDEVIAHPTIARLRQCCARIGGLTNDLFSYEKEVLGKGFTLNFVKVLETAHSCGFAEAVSLAIEFINGETRDFYAKVHELPRFDAETDERVARYVEGLKYQIGATWHWQMFTGRYRSPTSPFAELRTT